MVTLWTIAGAVVGWIVIEVVAAFAKAAMPLSLNIGLAFVGALTAYSIAS